MFPKLRTNKGVIANPKLYGKPHSSTALINMSGWYLVSSYFLEHFLEQTWPQFLVYPYGRHKSLHTTQGLAGVCNSNSLLFLDFIVVFLLARDVEPNHISLTITMMVWLRIMWFWLPVIALAWSYMYSFGTQIAYSVVHYIEVVRIFHPTYLLCSWGACG